MPAALVNFQSWLAAQGLRVQDGILPEDNVTDSLNSAWESISSASSHGFAIAPALPVTLYVAPAQPEVISVDVVVSAITLNVSISIQGNDLATVLVNEVIPRSIFTAYLSRSILSLTAAFGPWRAGYGLPPLDLQMTVPQISFQVEN